MLPRALLLSLVTLWSAAADVSALHALPLLAPGLAQRLAARRRDAVPALASDVRLVVQATDGRARAACALAERFPAHTHAAPVSHFPDDARYGPHVDATFALRYWVDDTFYDGGAGGPVYVLLGGETSGADRLAFLESGILRILGEATRGLGIVLEHRYYGESWPVSNLTTDDLRFLDTAQALADVAHFIEHVDVPGVGRIADAPVIVYGGSYAGAQAAFLRALYPDLVFGAIASSAVTTAVTDYWAYFDAIRRVAPADCIATVVESIDAVDGLLALGVPEVTATVKRAFGLANVTDDLDFVNALALPLGYWQARNWDDAVGSSGFERFCDALAAPPSATSADLADELAAVTTERQQRGLAGLANYARYSAAHLAPLCDTADQDACFATHDAEALQQTGREQTWRAWLWQTCTEVRSLPLSAGLTSEHRGLMRHPAQWGYWMPAPPPGVPSLVSRLIGIERIQDICPLAFPAGKHASVPDEPDVARVNRYGNVSLAYDRLAFIDGAADPWRPATPHAREAPRRRDLAERPFKLIRGGVHHWDENGRRDAEPPAIRAVHAQEVAFVRSWLREWDALRRP